MDPEPAPDLCLRCGRCCYAKLIIDGEVVYTPFPCRHLDAATRLCTVYERRHEANPDCISLEEGIRLGVFPGDCPYVRDIPGYVPPRLELTEEEWAEFAEDVAEVEEAVRPSKSETPSTESETNAKSESPMAGTSTTPCVRPRKPGLS